MNQALLGPERHDISKLIAGQQKVTAALSSNEGQLKDLITNFNMTMGASPRRRPTSARPCGSLPVVLEEAQPALDNLNAAFPPTRAWALAMIPGVEQTAPTIEPVPVGAPDEGVARLRAPGSRG